MFRIARSLMIILLSLCSAVAISREWKTIPVEVLGFPFEIVSQSDLICYEGQSQYVARQSIYRLEKEDFTIRNLQALFKYVDDENPSDQELHVLVLSDVKQTQFLSRPHLMASHFGFLDDLETGINRILNFNLGFCEFYRFGLDELFSYQLPGTIDRTGAIIFKGTDPYDSRRVGFPFAVLLNELRPDFQTYVECLDRELYVLIRPCDWSRSNLNQLLESLATRFPIPESLTIWVYPNISEIQRRFMRDGRFVPLISSRIRPELAKCGEGTESDSRGHVLYTRSEGISYYNYYGGIGPAERVELPLHKRGSESD